MKDWNEMAFDVRSLPLTDDGSFRLSRSWRSSSKSDSVDEDIRSSSSEESVKAVSESYSISSASRAASGFNQVLYQRPRKILMSELRPRYSTLRAIPSHWMTPLRRQSAMTVRSPKYIQWTRRWKEEGSGTGKKRMG